MKESIVEAMVRFMMEYRDYTEEEARMIIEEEVEDGIGMSTLNLIMTTY